ncbi:hypothetical protein BM221_004185 [Beauveria bassiana]|uniref:Uncharacterized protein n=1 Tax=Beauveria bassiana TaxID=176275 RepID=A0A2N6NQI8_BEABA|nr:hypothetical protein BM221_004185 [Beauveria bassiana]
MATPPRQNRTSATKAAHRGVELEVNSMAEMRHETGSEFESVGTRSLIDTQHVIKPHKAAAKPTVYI